jgi:hypothetical protein
MTIDPIIDNAVSRPMRLPVDSGFERAIAPDIWVDPAVDGKRIMDGPNIQTLQKLQPGTLADFTQGTPSARPFYEANGINGFGSVEITGSSQVLKSSNAAPSSQISFTAQFGFEYTNAAPGGDYVFSMTFEPTTQYLFTFNAVSKTFWCRPWRQFVGNVGDFVSTGTLEINTPVVLTIIYDVPNQIHALRINGVQDGFSSTVITNFRSGNDIFMLKHVDPVAVPSAIGFRMGAFIYNRNVLPSLNQIKARENYLMNRYL